MRPFEVAPILGPLRGTYPTASHLLKVARDGDRNTRQAIACLWLSEGIPFAFRDQPAIYESLRRWLARRLQVHEKEVTLVGSARLGFAIYKNRIVGRTFSNHSDLDLTVVSSSLFSRLNGDYERWAKEYQDGVASPRGPQERLRWDENLECCPPGLRRGFIDPHKIPLRDRYREAQLVAQAKWEAAEKLKLTQDAPVVRAVSLRVYRDWNAFVNQMTLNLFHVGVQHEVDSAGKRRSGRFTLLQLIRSRSKGL